MLNVRRCVVLAFVLLAMSPVQAQSATAPSALETVVRGIAAEHHGQVTLYAKNLKTGAVVAIDADKPVQTASVIKLTILYEALEQVREGKASFGDKITMTAADQVPGSGVVRFFDTPMTLTLKDALTMMIQMSDNTATNLVIDHVGLDNVNARIAKMGLKDTHLYKKVFTPVPAGVTMPADYKVFGLGKSTAREMAEVMTKLVTCDVAEDGRPAEAGDAALCGVAVTMLQRQFYRNTIPRYLDALPGATGDSIASKTGSLEAVRADVAAVSTKNGMVVISCFTFDNKDHSWGVEQEGELTIAKIARALVAEWSPAGLTGWPKVVEKPVRQAGL